MQIKRFKTGSGDLQEFLKSGQVDMEAYQASVLEIAQLVKSQGDQGNDS